MIHVTKDRVLVTNMVFLNGPEDYCIKIDEGSVIPCEITGNIFLSSSLLYEMACARKPDLWRRIKLAYRYIKSGR